MRLEIHGTRCTHYVIHGIEIHELAEEINRFLQLYGGEITALTCYKEYEKED